MNTPKHTPQADAPCLQPIQLTQRSSQFRFKLHLYCSTENRHNNGEVPGAEPRTLMIDNPHLSLAQIQSILYPYILKCNLGRNCNFPTPRELATDQEVRMHAIELFSTMLKFGSVRNPWARMFSIYRRKEGVQVSSRISFSEFLNNIQYASDTCLHPLKMRSKLDWFRDEKGKIAMDYIFKLEEIEKAIKQIEEMSNGRITIQNKKERESTIRVLQRRIYPKRGENRGTPIPRRDRIPWLHLLISTKKNQIDRLRNMVIEHN